MEMLSRLLQLTAAVFTLIWTAYMDVRIVTGGYDVTLIVVFTLMLIVAGAFVLLSIEELKGGEE